ncbi:uncharacterized protein ARMOST_12711 [Armillaria ostoyae]|uniref:Nephrocystin 3-like N-terminal domain-containing protein n=1 Tax=Armillaria ostoyae TaxID=47428 RepID=A0A284RKR4_ARMOS|nr:uncharacterized protein ARMOST_12711 [Armillaria ostoyae]
MADFSVHSKGFFVVFRVIRLDVNVLRPGTSLNVYLPSSKAPLPAKLNLGIGVGKIILASIIIDYLRSLPVDEKKTLVLSIFCDYQSAAAQTVNLLCSLLNQDNRLSAPITLLYNQCLRDGTRSSLNVLTSFHKSWNHSTVFTLFLMLWTSLLTMFGRSRFLTPHPRMTSEHISPSQRLPKETLLRWTVHSTQAGEERLRMKAFGLDKGWVIATA